MTKTTVEFAVTAEVALSYIPCILAKLADDPDLPGMFANVLQAMRDGGYEDGLRDGRLTRK